MTMCSAEAPGGVFSVSCETKDIEKANFAAGKWKHAVEYRVDGVRLYGPNGNNITYDLEPEGGAFTEDGLYQLVVIQDNDAYAMYDVAAGKYIFMGGFSGMASTSTLDGSDKDDKINLRHMVMHQCEYVTNTVVKRYEKAAKVKIGRLKHLPMEEPEWPEEVKGALCPIVHQQR